MASLRKNKHNQWVISIQSLGFNTTLCTKTQSKVDANRVRRLVEGRVDQVKLDGSHPFHSWPKDDQLTWMKTGREPQAKADALLTVSQAIKKYVEFKEGQNRALNTTRGYEIDLRAARKRFADIPLQALNATMLQDWVSDLAKTTIENGSNRGKKLSVKSQKVKADALKRVVRHFQSLGEPGLNDRVFDAITYGVSEPDELSHLTAWTDFDRRLGELNRLGIESATEGAFKRIILTESQLKEQFSYLEAKLYNDGTLASTRLYATVYFCCVTGARRSELARVRRRDLLLGDDLPLVTLLKRKGRKDKDLLMQKAVLPNKLIPVLERLLRLLPAGQECLFTSDDKHLTSSGFNEKVERSKANYLSKHLVAALEGSKWEHSAGWHLYRHTFASRLLANGYSKTDVMELIGWCSDSMAQRYQHQTFDRKSAIINSLI